jgi:hypothetical protein
MNYKGNFGQDPGQSTVVVQCQHNKQELVNRILKQNDVKEKDKYFFYHKPPPTNFSDASSRIDRGDLVFSVGTTSCPRSVVMKEAIPVVADIRGMYVRRNNDDEMHLNQANVDEVVINNKLSRSIRFIGVSLGMTDPNPNDMAKEKSGITVRVKGTCKIFNNGSSTIVPGDTLIWVLPTSTQLKASEHLGRYGRSDDKITPIIVPLRQYHKTSLDENLQSLLPVKSSDDFSKNMFPYPTTDCAILLKKLLLKVYASGKFSGLVVPAPTTAAPPGMSAHAYLLKLIDEDTTSYTTSIKPPDANAVAAALAKSTATSVPLLNTALVDDKILGLNKSLYEIANYFISFQEDIKRRTVGIAYSYSDPGTDVTVLLGN